MRRNCLIATLTALLAAGLALPLRAQSQSDPRYPITPRQVARTLSSNGMETADEQVTLPAYVVATEPHPALDILSVEPLLNAMTGAAQPRSTVKLVCHEATSCLPFFAIVEGLQAPETPTAAALAAPRMKQTITMRAGTHAILVMDDHVAHIQVAVITLENGMPGKWIRVASPDRKQFYRAEVVGDNLLRGAF